MDYRIPDSKPGPSRVCTRQYRGLLPSGRTVSQACSATNIFLYALLCLIAYPANAAPKPPLAWACWISEQTPVSIKCIRDRSHLREATLDDEEAALRSLRPDTADEQEDKAGQLPQAAPHRRSLRQQAAMGDPEDKPDISQTDRNLPHQEVQDHEEDELEAEVLDEIYGKILAGDTSRLDDLLEKHDGSLRKGSIYTIKIHSLPLDSSWVENRPVRVVKSALCRGNRSCSVILREPGH